MARIRTIKPEFFTSNDIVSLEPLARLLYIALWCEADREGRLKWDELTLKMRYLPADDVSIKPLMTQLKDRGLVIPYKVGDKFYAFLPAFKTHQVVNNRESESVLPPQPDACVTRESGVPDACKGKGKEGKGREGKGKEEEDIPAAPVASATSEPEIGQVIFEMASELLKMPEKPARALVGKARRDVDDATLLAILESMRIHKPVDPASWFLKSVQTKAEKAKVTHGSASVVPINKAAWICECCGKPASRKHLNSYYCPDHDQFSPSLMAMAWDAMKAGEA